MASAIAPVVPRTIARAKNVAKSLQDIYEVEKLSVCQATTAHLFGHKDWHALDEAVKQRASSAPYDEQLAPGARAARWSAQCAIVCRELAGVDPEADNASPEDPAHKESMTEAEFGAYLMARDRQNDERATKAMNRWQIFLASEVVEEILPTTEARPQRRAPHAFFAQYTPEQLIQLPGALARWWKVNISHQPEVGAFLGAWRLNPNSAVALTQFGGYWGTLCHHYARTIDWTMVMGVAMLVGERYAELKAYDSAEMRNLVALGPGAPPESKQSHIDALYGVLEKHLRAFFRAYPRDDFVRASDGLGKFQEQAAVAIEILASPRSRRGIWRS